MRCVTWINGLLERNKPKRRSTCSLTEARMLLAVLSASMLRPVELSRMVSRSPSSVTGLCSGAGIPPVQNTHTQTHNMIWSPQALFWKGKKEKNPQSCTHIPNKLCACMRAQTHNHSQIHTGGWWGVTINGHTPPPTPPAIHKRTPTHAIWHKEKKAVNVSCLWQCKSTPYGLETTQVK